MKTVRYYDSRHPLVAARIGDPARGEWAPKSAQRRQKSKKPGRNRASR